MFKIASALNGSYVRQSVTTLGKKLLSQVKNIIFQKNKNNYFIFFEKNEKLIFWLKFFCVHLPCKTRYGR